MALHKVFQSSFIRKIRDLAFENVRKYYFAFRQVRFADSKYYFFVDREYALYVFDPNSRKGVFEWYG